MAEHVVPVTADTVYVYQASQNESASAAYHLMIGVNLHTIIHF